jgi:hypothetical protein
MKTVRILVVAAIAAGAMTVVGSPSLRAQSSAPSPEAMKAATELVGLFNAQLVADTVTNLTAQVWPPVEAALREQNKNIDAATLTELRKEFERLMVANYNEVMKDAPAIYAKHFSAQEMRELVAFYKTPVGAKSLRVLPQAMADINAKMAPRLQGLQERVSLAFLNILQKRGLYAQ